MTEPMGFLAAFDSTFTNNRGGQAHTGNTEALAIPRTFPGP